MSSVEFTNTSNAAAIYSQPEALKEKINDWLQKPNTYDDQSQSFFVESINRYAIDVVENFKFHIITSGEERLKAIKAKCNLDEAALKLAPSLIAKSFVCGTLGGVAATQMTVAMAIASCATPAGWIGGTGTAMVYYHFDKQDQKGKIRSKALLDIEKTDRVAEKMLSSLELSRSRTENSRLNRINTDLNAQITAVNQEKTTLNNQLDAAHGRIDELKESLTIANGRIEALNTDVENTNGQLATAQAQISSLNGNIATLQQENRNLRTDLASNQIGLTTTAARIDELQTQNALNLASVQQMNRDLIAEMRSEFLDRERIAAAKQIAERGIEKALRQEQEKKNSQLIFDLTRKSAAFEVLQSEHDQLADQIGHKFDVMTQAMSRNPHESSFSELLRSNDQRDVSGSDSESNGDFIEVAHQM